MDFELGGFTKNLVLPTLGKREAPQNVMPNLDVSHATPSLKRGKFDEVNIDEISAGVRATLAGSNEAPKLELPRAWEPLDRSKPLQNCEGTSSQCLFSYGNKTRQRRI